MQQSFLFGKPPSMNDSDCITVLQQHSITTAHTAGGRWDLPSALSLPKSCIMTYLSPTEQTQEAVDHLCCRDEIMATRGDTQSSQRSVSRLLSQRAQHHGLVTGIAGQNPTFSRAARLAVRWVAAHMMAGIHLPVEAIELMLVAAFLPGATPVAAPGRPSQTPMLYQQNNMSKSHASRARPHWCCLWLTRHCMYC